LATYPLDVLRTRLVSQVKANEFIGVLPLIKLMASENKNPLRAFFRGFMPTIYGILPYAGVSFYSYETLKVLAIYEFGEINNGIKLGCGAISGAVAQTVAYPLDVVRRHMQLQHSNSHLPHYKNTADVFRKLVKLNGFKSLFIGLSVNYIKVGPATGVSFVVYEFMKGILGLKE
jgi:solute carrier family 25 protein 16